MITDSLLEVTKLWSSVLCTQQFLSGFKREVSLPSSFLRLSGISQNWHEGNYSTCQLVPILCSSTKNTYSVTLRSLLHEKLVLIYRWSNLLKMTQLQWSWECTPEAPNTRSRALLSPSGRREPWLF